MKIFGDLVRQAMERQGLKELGLAKKAKFGQGYLNSVSGLALLNSIMNSFYPYPKEDK